VDAVPKEVRRDAVPNEVRDVLLSLDRTKWGGDAVSNKARDASLTLGTME